MRTYCTECNTVYDGDSCPVCERRDAAAKEHDIKRFKLLNEEQKVAEYGNMIDFVLHENHMHHRQARQEAFKEKAWITPGFSMASGFVFMATFLMGGVSIDSIGDLLEQLLVMLGSFFFGGLFVSIVFILVKVVYHEIIHYNEACYKGRADTTREVIGCITLYVLSAVITLVIGLVLKRYIL